MLQVHVKLYLCTTSVENQRQSGNAVKRLLSQLGHTTQTHMSSILIIFFFIFMPFFYLQCYDKSVICSNMTIVSLHFE